MREWRGCDLNACAASARLHEAILHLIYHKRLMIDDYATMALSFVAHGRVSGFAGAIVRAREKAEKMTEAQKHIREWS
jgi:hypothetical protein